MPFAVIAVTLLVMASAYGAVSSQIRDGEKRAENIVEELGSIDRAIEGSRVLVERGLGEIIYEISADEGGGTLAERGAEFERRAGEWMSSAFPRTDAGVRITVSGYSAEMRAKPMRLSGSDSVSDGFSPAYLKAEGHFSAAYESETGVSERTVAISTDGSCALPLVAEMGSLFEGMASGDGSVLAQSMSYQLTALAQYRVLNGYGALAERGSMGTMSILTADDVLEAYRSSLEMLGALTFRTSGDGGLAGRAGADMAGLLASRDGYAELDLSAAYAQALVSIADDLALKWADYFYGGVVCDAADRILDGVSNALDSLRGFLKGSNEFSAAPYIDQAMRDSGMDQSRYRHAMSGKSFAVSVPAGRVAVTVNGASHALDVEGFSVSVPYPDADLMSWGAISKFKSAYRAETNELREWFRSVIASAAAEVGASKALGTMRFRVDPYGGEAFLDSMARSVSEHLKGGDAAVERIMTSAISSQTIIDPFYAAIYGVVSRDAYAIYGVDSFESKVREFLKRAISDELDARHGTVLDPSAAAGLAEEAMKSQAVRGALSGYRAEIDDIVRGFDALNRVPGGQSGIIKKVCAAVVRGGLGAMDPFVDVPMRISGLCAEAAENARTNAWYGVTELPGDDAFRLVGAGGERSVERLKVTYASDPRVRVGGPRENAGDNVHYVGFNDKTGASYSTAFSVRLTDSLTYAAEGSGALEEAMGTRDSAMRGTVGVDLDLKITVASGWGLAGAGQYRASNTFFSDAWNVLIKLLEPVLEPLRKVVSIIMDALSILGSAIMEISKYVAKIVERLYSAMMEPLESLGRFIEEKLGKIFDPIMEKAVEKVQTIVGIDLSKQTVGFSFMGFTVTFTTKMNTWVNETKTLLTVGIGCVFDKVSVSGSLTVKQKGAGSGKELMMAGDLEIKGRDWSVKGALDPAMKSSKHMLTLSGVARGVKFDAALPHLVQYRQTEFTLCDVPALATILSNIPVPIPGMKASIDAGVSLKYNAPFKTGLLINEFESNPPGPDSGREWVELYNATRSPIDLEGYAISSGVGKKTHVITGMSISPGQRVVITLPGSFLNNEGSAASKSGEYVTLKDPSGEVVDKTPAKKDTANDERSWQRAADGATEWVFAPSTPGTANCGGLVGGEMIRAQVLSILKESAVKTMGKFGSLKSIPDVSEFFKIAIQDAISTAIERLAGMLVEAAIFISIDITDATSTACAGMRAALSIDSGMVDEGLKYLIGEIEALLFSMENPYGLKPKEVLAENLRLGVTVYAGMTSPKFLKSLESHPKAKIGVRVDSNVAGLTRLAGKDTGKWEVEAGVLIMGCPAAAIPPMFKADKTLESDLWLLRMTFSEARK
jgi:hypothetical protein